MYTFSTKEKTISIFPSLEATAPIIYLNTVSGEGQKVFKAAQAVGCPPFTLIAVSGLDWNRDMAPWDGPAAFKQGEPFTGGADDYLRLLVEEIIPRAEKELPGPPAWRGIAGYSLAGLFALYAIYQTNHIRGDRVVLTDERRKHIIERRGEAEFEALQPYFAETLRDPDYIFRDKDEHRTNTALVCKKVEQDGRYVNVVLHLAVEKDADRFQHSIITAMFRGEKSMRRTKRTHELIYEREKSPNA